MSFLYTTPDAEYGTFGELNGSLVHANNESSPAFKELLDNNIPLYPSIRFESLAPQIADYVNEEPQQVSLLESAYNDIKTTVEQQLKSNLPLIESSPVYKQGKKVYDYIHNNYLKTPDFALEHSIFNEDESIKCIAWHPHLEIIALAAKDNQVYIYEKTESDWTCQVLRHDKMKQITCLEWKQRSSGTLAVGCEVGVCVWTIQKASGEKQPQFHPLATMRYFSHADQAYVSALAWDPTPGSHLLAVVSALSNTLVVHDLLLNKTIPLKRYGKGNVLLRWSPNGEWLFEGGSAGHSRLWDTRNWNSRQIMNPPGLWIQAACWSPDNRTLIYSMGGKSDLHAIFLPGADVKSGLVDVEIISTPVTTIETNSGVKTSVGGIIRDISIDRRNGQRLAIAYENSDLISLYSVKKVSPLNLRQEPMLYPIGYLRGAISTTNSYGSLEIASVKSDAKPLHITFSSTYKEGAVLAIAWSNGLVTFSTHTFLTDEEMRKRFL